MTPDERRLEAESRGIFPPQPRTLGRYGITADDWLALLECQGWKCAVCERTGRKWNTDHEHVPGWMKMPDDRRRIYVRGILCWHCNRRVVPSNLSAADARRVHTYLDTYEKRRADALKEIDSV